MSISSGAPRGHVVPAEAAIDVDAEGLLQPLHGLRRMLRVYMYIYIYI